MNEKPASKQKEDTVKVLAQGCLQAHIKLPHNEDSDEDVEVSLRVEDSRPFGLDTDDVSSPDLFNLMLKAKQRFIARNESFKKFSEFIDTLYNNKMHRISLEERTVWNSRVEAKAYLHKQEDMVCGHPVHLIAPCVLKVGVSPSSKCCVTAICCSDEHEFVIA
jgi:hypothetical protein